MLFLFQECHQIVTGVVQLAGFGDERLRIHERIIKK
jgi:hypothetical protein